MRLPAWAGFSWFTSCRGARGERTFGSTRGNEKMDRAKNESFYKESLYKKLKNARRRLVNLFFCCTGYFSRKKRNPFPGGRILPAPSAPPVLLSMRRKRLRIVPPRKMRKSTPSPHTATTRRRLARLRHRGWPVALEATTSRSRLSGRFKACGIVGNPLLPSPPFTPAPSTDAAPRPTPRQSPLGTWRPGQLG